MHIAYLLNQYPYTSCTFIRREILEVERLGLRISRFSIRPTEHQLVDENDRAEAQKTHYLLSGAGSAIGLLVAALVTAITRPVRFLSALRLAIDTGWRSERGVIWHLAYLVEACGILRWCRQMDITHIHCHFGTNPTAVAMLCRVLGGPTYSFTVHGPEEFDKPAFLNLREKIHHAEFVAAISYFGRSQLYRQCPYDQWSKIHVVRCGVDAGFLHAEHVPPPREPRLVCVGRLGETKGQMILIDAAARLAAEGVDFEITLVGDGPLRRQLEAAIARHNLGDRIHLAGWASNQQVRQHMQNARALVLPSFAEGLPVVFMEALALRRPVITTYIAGIPELVQPGINGWLVPSSSVDDLVEAMRQALTAPVEVLERMGQAGAERVAQQHNVATEAGKIACLFRKVANA